MTVSVDVAQRFRDFKCRKHFGSLDGLRAISILGVVWHHAARGSDLPWALEGAMGVPLFFAISGFLITTLLLRERDRTGDISLGAFYARRSLRIFPLYYTVLLVYVAVVALLEKNVDDKAAFFSNLKFFATYTSNWFVKLDGDRVIFYFAWSLATEEQFYLVWPSVERFLGKRLTHAPVLVALGLVTLWSLARFGVLPVDGFARTLLLSIAPAICMGVVLAHVMHDERGYAVVARLVGWRLSSLLLLVAMLASLAMNAELVSFFVMTLLVASCVVREDHGLERVLRAWPMQSVGQVSYGIYLMHMLVVNVVERGLKKLTFLPASFPLPVVVFPLAFAAVWIVAVVSFHTYEARFLKLKARFSR
jgi:peptidoglycan/LPS O-acetylase OafA/YrhL